MSKPRFSCVPFLPRCNALCCGPCPIPAATWRTRQGNLQAPPAIAKLDGEGYIHQVAANGDCCFKRPDFTCAIYPAEGQPDPRAEVCRLMGKHPQLQCPWQDEQGRARPRRERRAVLREQEERIGRVLAWARKRGRVLRPR